MDSGLILAALVAGLAALMGSRTALALLCSLVASFLMTGNLGLILLDLAVLAVILRPNMTLADELIAALFIVSWAGMLGDDQLRYDASYAVVVLQMLLCLPVERVRLEATILSEFVTDAAAFIRSRFMRSAPLSQHTG